MEKIEFLDIPPLQGVAGSVKVPGSKSITNRALLLAALCNGETRLKGVLDSDDTQAMLGALQKLGCQLKYDANHLDEEVLVTGLSKERTTGSSAAPLELFLNNAGTVMRPLTAILALLGGSYLLKGVQRMHERPIRDLVEALQDMGCCIQYLENDGYPPLQIESPSIKDSVYQEAIKVRGDVSSQFLSALLMALPLIANKPITVEVEGELISKPYVNITLKLMRDFGVEVLNQNDQRFQIPAGAAYRSPSEYVIESDASSASYFIAAGVLAATKENPLMVQGVGINSIQGDIRFIDAVRAMGGEVVAAPDYLMVSRGSRPLKAIELDCNHIPDAAMTLAVLALYAEGTTRLTNIASWRVKETDRIEAMGQELKKLGATVNYGDDFIEITPPKVWQNAPIKTYDDHRVAMCFSLAAWNAQGQGIRLLDPACVNKTYPDYFADLFSVAHAKREDIPVIAIDGPTASGKGTLASLVAQRLGYHYLDSGSLYRVTALALLQQQMNAEDEALVVACAEALPVSFKSGRVWYQGDDVTDAIRAEEVGVMASKIAVYPAVREALLSLQRSFQQLPGVVADGRDMGTVVFPEAQLKIYLTADAMARAKRRYKQLIDKGVSVTLDSLLGDLKARDERDMNRAIAPLQPADDALLLDNSDLGIEACVIQVLNWWEDKRQILSTSKG